MTGRPTPPTHRRADALLRERILVLDGAMGTRSSGDRPGEAGYRGERFADWPSDLKGNNDLLTLTQPDIIRAIHREYLAAGADIIETNTFNANADLAGRLRHAGPRLRAQPRGRAAGPRGRRRGRRTAGPPALRRRRPRARPRGRPRSRPTSTTPAPATCPSTSSSTAYLEQARGLVDGGADLLLVETIFDTLNAKAAIFALETLFEEQRPALAGDRLRHDHRRLRPHPVRPGHRGVLGLVRHARPLAVGLNCALGAREMRPYVAELSRLADSFVSVLPQRRVAQRVRRVRRAARADRRRAREFADAGFLNLVGGCCGTTPDHIGAIAAADGPAWCRSSRRPC